jgi:LysR family glycine cleavage system transcriptional activator
MRAVRRILPKINELVAFEAAARHLNFTRAAVELNLTQGAVSRSIGELEQRLGVRLFERVRKRVVMTDAGRAYADDIRRLLEEVRCATLRMMATEPGGQVFNLAVLPTFATQWLIRHLHDFHSKFPGVTVNVTTRIRPFSFEEEPLDAAIHHGRATWPGAITRHLMDESLFPMSSREYRAAMGLRTPRDLRKATLIHQSTRLDAWARWHAQAGLSAQATFRGPTYDQFSMTAAAAAAGLGVALLPQFLVERQVAESGLEVLFDLPLRSASAYYLAVPETGAKVVAHEFGGWLATLLRSVYKK